MNRYLFTFIQSVHSDTELNPIFPGPFTLIIALIQQFYRIIHCFCLVKMLGSQVCPFFRDLHKNHPNSTCLQELTQPP